MTYEKIKNKRLTGPNTKLKGNVLSEMMDGHDMLYVLSFLART
jgi:hypothetical protein